MAKDLATTGSTTRLGPSTTSRTFSDLLAQHQSGIERIGRTVETTKPPDQHSRLVLRDRYNELLQGLGQGSRDARGVGIAVADLLRTFQKNPTGDDAQRTVAKYVEVLADRPAWVVRRACEQIARGQVEGVSLDFPPTAARLRDVVNKLLEPFFVEATQIREVLTAQIRRNPNPEERERLGKLFADLAAELRGNAAAMDNRKPAKAPEPRAFADSDF